MQPGYMQLFCGSPAVAYIPILLYKRVAYIRILLYVTIAYMQFFCGSPAVAYIPILLYPYSTVSFIDGDCSHLIGASFCFL